MTSQTSTVPLRRNGAVESGTFCFGRFRLNARERLLLKDDTEVSVGSRAFDMLLTLVERAGETVNRRELFARVWPDVIVAKVNLRVHIAGLRKLLDDGQDGNRFIVSVACQGYRFVAPVSRIHPVMPALESMVCFVDLAGIDDPRRVATAVASALQCEVNEQQLTSGLVTHLKDKEMLLAFDNCDHVFAGVAQLTERLLHEAPLVHILIRRQKALRRSHTLAAEE